MANGRGCRLFRLRQRGSARSTRRERWRARVPPSYGSDTMIARPRRRVVWLTSMDNAPAALAGPGPNVGLWYIDVALLVVYRHVPGGVLALLPGRHSR